MVKFLGAAALLAAVVLWPIASADAEHGHGHSGGHGHSSGHGHSGGHGHIGVHIGGHGHNYGHDHHSSWHYVVPHYDRHYHGSYYLDGGVNYYVPQTYVSDSRAYVAAKPVQIEFGGYAHVDDLSGRLERLVNQLCLDLYYNYRHNPGWAETYRGAFQILNTVKYIHSKEHQGDRAEVARRLDEVDGLFHQVQDQISGWSRQNNRKFGESDTETKIALVEATLHHLMNDVGVKGAHGAPEAAAESSSNEEAAPAPDDQEPAAPVSVPPPASVPLPPPAK